MSPTAVDGVVVVGGSVAALVAADALGAAGRPVSLLLPERGIGGSFAPVRIGDRALDLGPRVVELSYDGPADPAPALGSYRPGPHGHRPYLALVERLVRELAGDDLVEVRSPETSVDGRRGADYVLAGDLSGITQQLAADELAEMAAEAERCVASEGAHGVFDPAREGERWQRSFGDVGRSHTGPRFHARLIESVAAKILPGGTDEVLAALHRKIWLPLFHPVTALEACRGELSYRPRRPMYTIAGGGMGRLPERLLARAGTWPSVRVATVGALQRVGVTGGGTDVELGFADGSEVRCTAPILAASPDELFHAAGVEHEAERVVATMVWLDVAAADAVDVPSVLFAAEPDVAVFRVTRNTADEVAGVHTLCCELRHDAGDDLGWPELARRSLEQLGVLRPGGPAQVVAAASRPSYAVPSATNRDRFEAARRALEALRLPVLVAGGATAFGADSFNEQVVQGLRAAEARSA